MRLVFKLDLHGKLWVMFCQHVSFNKASATPYMEDKATTARCAWSEAPPPAQPGPSATLSPAPRRACEPGDLFEPERPPARAPQTVSAKPAWLEKAKKTWDSAPPPRPQKAPPSAARARRLL